MAFIPISIDKYVRKHLKNNPNENEAALRERLQAALSTYNSKVKCSCGNDIWVVGSAVVGNSCFTCITGEADPTDDYEIDKAVRKSDSIEGRRHIDDLIGAKFGGFFDDDGYEVNLDLIKKPSLCVTCINNDNPHEEILCQMTRHDQRDDEEFICHAYKKM